eukprot:246223-Prorocentrum_minimum.AAC.4
MDMVVCFWGSWRCVGSKRKVLGREEDRSMACLRGGRESAGGGHAVALGALRAEAQNLSSRHPGFCALTRSHAMTNPMITCESVKTAREETDVHSRAPASLRLRVRPAFEQSLLTNANPIADTRITLDVSTHQSFRMLNCKNAHPI